MVWRADWNLVVALIVIVVPILGLLVYLFIRTIDQSAKRSHEPASSPSEESFIQQTPSEDG